MLRTTEPFHPTNILKLKKQNVPYRWERFEKMIEGKKNRSQHSVTSRASGKFATDTLSKKENLNEMEFDVTQWHNTLWTKRNNHLKLPQFSSLREDDYLKESVDKGLAVDGNSPPAIEIPGEVFDKKAEKGSYFMRPAAISIGIDSLELVSFIIYS
ncbi:unnamed protein product [Cercopithifilaria johnstoni]|uniref:Uncharacterized protein n=1 Tax=Cercopithifilaria johnstoni TaxID=2874296 RepID=A0A8J2LWC8_9BILA|nr:unnamed protein product [Cercopithifilaria johnstoni]